jgi:putative NADH-flavin reductase
MASPRAQSAQLDIFRSLAKPLVIWTFVSPSLMIAPGQRTGAYRLGADQLLLDNAGESKISAEDFATAIVDEVETQLIRTRVLPPATEDETSAREGLNSRNPRPLPLSDLALVFSR